MSKIIITADSTADLSKELAEKYQIKMVPLYINLEEVSHADDGVDIVPDDIYNFVKTTGKLPTTSANPIGNYEELFRDLTSQGYDVVHLNISSGFSCTHQNACIAAEDFENVFVVDSRNLSTGSGLLALEAARMRDEGKSAAEIAEALKEFTPKVDASFVVDDLNYLHKGGRCSSVAKLGANLLKLKPCIQVKDGSMGVSKKYRGDYKACIVNYIKEKLVDTETIDPRRVFVTHTKCDDGVVKAAIDTIKECFEFEEVIDSVAGCTVTTHCGPNTLGILFLRKENI